MKRLFPLVLVAASFTLVGCNNQKKPAPASQAITTDQNPPAPQPYTPPADNSVPTESNPGPAPMANNTGTEAPVHHTTHHHAMASSAHHGRYIVKAGDTLSKIAHAHHVSLKHLEAANPKVDPNKIRVGQTIMIP